MLPPTTRRALHTLSSRLPASYYRGGTSRALFFQLKDLPQDKSQWAPIFLGVLGSPDQYGRQLDGMGGGISSLSKICIVGPSTTPGEADVDYTFVAVGVKETTVDYSGNCGNMISAVGPFAVDSSMMTPTTALSDDSESKTTTTVRIRNTNTNKIIHSTFSLFPTSACGKEVEFDPTGTFTIDGVSGTASPIQLDFMNPAGSKTGKLLPTGNKIDVIDGLRVSCVDVANPCVFVPASELGVDGGLSPAEIDQHPTLLERLESIRKQAGVKMGLAKTIEEVPASVPKINMVSLASQTDTGADLRVRAISVGQPHKAVPVTVALATAAAAKLEGTVVHECVPKGTFVKDDGSVTIAHASGTLRVGAKFYSEGGELEYATVFRTARRLMEGTVFWK